MSVDLKEQVRKIVERKNLCSYMNDTKWNELRMAMINDMPFLPPYILKFVFDDEPIENASFYNNEKCMTDWHYVFAIDGQYFNGSFAVEWIKIRPRLLKHRGKLVEPEVIDAEDIFVEILKKYSIPYECEGDGVYCIYGYR